MSVSVSPTIHSRETHPTAVIPVEASLQQWNNAIDKIPVIIAWIQQHGVEPAGPLFFRYLRIGDYEKPYSLELGFPLDTPVSGTGEVVRSEIPGGDYLVHDHAGHPDQLFDVDEALRDWTTANQISLDVRTKGGAEHWIGKFEFFLTNPEEQPDPNEWQTEVAWKIKDGAEGP